ncbi:hypothetical protein TorRG33x02_139220, partial [Trema orientale]
APATSKSEVTSLENSISSNDGAAKATIFQHRWSCPTDVAAYETIVEKKQIYKFLFGLNENLDEVRCRILATNSLPNIRDVFSEVRCEESRRKLKLGSPPGLNQSESLALPAHSSTTSKENQQQRRSGRP